jgi:divalent metal cation (Fe/Co/Zn/Cd) transporter
VQVQTYTCPVAEPSLEIAALPLAGQHPARRERLERRARLLAVGGIAYHFLEFAIALGAGIAAGSIALIGFGADSLIEAFAGFVVLWLFTGARSRSGAAERRAQQLIAVSFFVLAAYVAIESVRTLAGGHHPETSWIGIGLAAFTAVTMPLFARAKREVGRQLGSSATVKEASQTTLCAYLSVALLVGLLLNAVGGLWWADPAAALVISLFAVKEGRESWRGEGCDCC